MLIPFPIICVSSTHRLNPKLNQDLKHREISVIQLNSEIQLLVGVKKILNSVTMCLHGAISMSN